MFPHLVIECHIIGPDVPERVHGLALSVPSPEISLCWEKGCSCGNSPPHTVRDPFFPPPLPPQPQGRLKLHFWRGLYHNLVDDPPHPTFLSAVRACNVVVGLNAGLPAYPSWIPTIQLLLTCRRPDDEVEGGSLRNNIHSRHSEAHPTLCLFTDYNEEAVHRTRLLCDAILEQGSKNVLSGSASHNSGLWLPEIFINPFRQPLRMRPTDNCLPTMRNGWSFALNLTR